MTDPEHDPTDDEADRAREQLIALLTPQEVVVLFIKTGDEITVGGAYASPEHAQAALDRVPWPCAFQFVRLVVGADLFPHIIEARITAVPDPDGAPAAP